MGLHGQLWAGEAGFGLEERDVTRVRGEVREAQPDLVLVEHVVGEIPLLTGPQAACHGQAVRGSDEQAAGHAVDVSTAVCGELVPQFVCAQEQRHIGRILEVGLADDAGAAVAGSSVVCGRELLQPQHALPAGGEMVGRGAAHAAQPDHDDVISHVATS